MSKVVSPVAAPVYGGYGGYGGYGAYGGYGVSKVVSPVATLGMCVVCICSQKDQPAKLNYHTLINTSLLSINSPSAEAYNSKTRLKFIFL